MAVPKNRQARVKHEDAIVALLLSYDKSLNLGQKTAITKSLNSLRKEHNAIKGRPGAKNYSEITGELTKSKNRLKKIKNERNQIKNDFITATKILNAMNGVLKLIT